MNDVELTRLTNKIVEYIHSNIDKDCLVVFQKYYSEVDLRMEIKDFIRDRYEALIDAVRKNCEILYNRYLISNSFRDIFLKVLYTTVSLRLLKQSAKVSMNVSFNDFNFECKHRIFQDMRKTADSVVYNTTTYFVDSYTLKIFENYTSFVIRSFKEDYEAAVKLLSGKKKKTRKRLIDAEFKRMYGVSLQTASSIYANISNDISLYGFLTLLFKKRKEKFTELPKEIIKNIKIESDYCTKEWIDRMVEEERERLIKMSEKFPSYTKGRIEREVEAYRRYLELKCKGYKKGENRQ